MKRKAYLLLVFLCIALILPCIRVSAASTENSLQLNETNLKLQVGNQCSLYLMNSNTNNEEYWTYYPCTWSSSNEDVAIVDDGFVTIVGKGKTTITATYNSKKYTCKITAYASSYRLTRSDLATKTFQEEYIRMTHTDDVSYYDYSIYRLDNSTETECYNAFRIDVDSETGKINLTALQGGEYRIDFYAHTYDYDTYQNQTYKASLHVTVQVHGLIETELGCALLTKRKLTFDDLSQITFTVENPEIASVDAHGIVTPLMVGETYVTMTGYNEQSIQEQFECTIYVTDPKVTLEKTYVVIDHEIPFNISGNSWIGQTEYKSSNEKIFTATSYGITAIKEGRAKVAVTVDGRKFVFDVEVVNPRLNQDSYLLKKNDTVKVTLLGLNGTLKQENVTYSIGNPKVASVSADGKITAKACGNTLLKVNLADFTFTASISVGNAKSISAIKNAKDALGSIYSQEKRMQKGYYDCSSLIWRSYSPTGITFGDSGYAPTAANIAKYLDEHKKTISCKFVDPKKLQPGDLIFYGGTDNGRFKGIYHVSMFTGIAPYDYYSYTTGSYYPYTGQIIHASQGCVRESDLTESYGNIVMIARPTK